MVDLASSEFEGIKVLLSKRIRIEKSRRLRTASA
jgi:hypothetical protein